MITRDDIKLGDTIYVKRVASSYGFIVKATVCYIHPENRYFCYDTGLYWEASFGDDLVSERQYQEFMRQQNKIFSRKDT